jgi:hypothetical protein
MTRPEGFFPILFYFITYVMKFPITKATIDMTYINRKGLILINVIKTISGLSRPIQQEDETAVIGIISSSGISGHCGFF